ncbi:MAG: TRAP transporter small permease [Geminicoccaceae bacterium]|nr:TRAP transporter small permease [Geminicoccaceae bacterium]MCB9968496.1 TRAP transporter small permease [Geminicoccaceae bacterium]HRY24961.1 TRAP transporter small permease [Geminicoccaceae bacterium]
MQGEAPRNDEFGFHLEEKPDPPFEWREFGLEDWPAFLVFWGLTVIVFLQFFTRYVLNDSFGWTEEAARYFLIGTTFIGGGMVCRRRAHIAVEYLHTRLSRAGSRRLMIVVDVITIAFLAYLGWVGWRMIGMMAPQKMAVIDLSMSWLYSVVFIGIIIMILRTAQSLLHRLQGDSPYPGDI